MKPPGQGALMNKFYVITIMIFTLLPVANADNNEGLALTALDRYVREPDSKYRYSVLDTVAGTGDLRRRDDFTAVADRRRSQSADMGTLHDHYCTY